ncbi:hypothetical protein EXIGLDRAFT_88508 [Exidia glandulosa HHB12029]|uniref:SUZ domain-containing protein n=1 Tax=Exidia glandulosa HHB12029 TaxID=1314781 RepID=A0A165NU26_EXIGL|nr:hypothetical protein EXIGLDRAFT_88508 [Exidia glandulosa HHB12029]
MTTSTDTDMPPVASTSRAQSPSSSSAISQLTESIASISILSPSSSTKLNPLSAPYIPTGILASPPPASMDDAEPEADAQILEALRSAKDRIYVLKLGENFEGLIGDRLTRNRLECPAQTTYQRLLVHRCAAYYRLQIEQHAETKALSVLIVETSRIPSRRLSELVPTLAPSEPAQPTFKIMRRDTNTPRSSAPSSRGGGGDDSADVSDSESVLSRNRKRVGMSIAEREAAYNAARERIFKQNSSMGVSASTSTASVNGSVSTTDEAESVSAVSIDDGATESEFSVAQTTVSTSSVSLSVSVEAQPTVQSSVSAPALGSRGREKRRQGSSHNSASGSQRTSPKGNGARKGRGRSTSPEYVRYDPAEHGEDLQESSSAVVGVSPQQEQEPGTSTAQDGGQYTPYGAVYSPAGYPMYAYGPAPPPGSYFPYAPHMYGPQPAPEHQPQEQQQQQQPQPQQAYGPPPPPQGGYPYATYGWVTSPPPQQQPAVQPQQQQQQPNGQYQQPIHLHPQPMTVPVQSQAQHQAPPVAASYPTASYPHPPPPGPAQYGPQPSYAPAPAQQPQQQYGPHPPPPPQQYGPPAPPPPVQHQHQQPPIPQLQFGTAPPAPPMQAFVPPPAGAPHGPVAINGSAPPHVQYQQQQQQHQPQPQAYAVIQGPSTNGYIQQPQAPPLQQQQQQYGYPATGQVYGAPAAPTQQQQIYAQPPPQVQVNGQQQQQHLTGHMYAQQMQQRPPPPPQVYGPPPPQQQHQQYVPQPQPQPAYAPPPPQMYAPPPPQQQGYIPMQQQQQAAYASPPPHQSPMHIGRTLPYYGETMQQSQPMNGRATQPRRTSGAMGPRMARRAPSSSSSIATSASSSASGGARTTADETASVASSVASSSSSSSRKTFTSTASGTHPLPPRPDWAIGMKPSPPTRTSGLPRHPNQPRPRPPQFVSSDFPPLGAGATGSSARGAWARPIAMAAMDYDRPPAKGDVELYNPRSGNRTATSTAVKKAPSASALGGTVDPAASPGDVERARTPPAGGEHHDEERALEQSDAAAADTPVPVAP